MRGRGLERAQSIRRDGLYVFLHPVRNCFKTIWAICHNCISFWKSDRKALPEHPACYIIKESCGVMPVAYVEQETEAAMRRIKIKNFGPIKEVDIGIDKNLEVIIGPQASGKSTFSKTLYFCKKIRDYFLQYLNDIMGTEADYTDELYVSFLKYIRRPFLGYFGTTKHMDAFWIRYDYEAETGRYVVITLGQDRYAKFAFSDVLRKDICDLIREAIALASKKADMSFSAGYLEQAIFITGARQRIQQIFRDDCALLYIPAGRNLLATLPNSIIPERIALTGHWQENGIDISQTDLITQEFVEYIRSMRTNFGSRLEEVKQNYLKTVKGQIRNQDVDLACRLIHEILRADYVYDKDGEKLFYDDEHWVKLMFGSSGQQEIVWALNIIFLAILKNEKTFLVFEEPESHLFPDAQEKIAQLVALMIYSSKSQAVITTHSPYMLTAFNLLIYSGTEERGGHDEGAVVRREYRIMPGTVGAYFISAETGRLKNIVSEKRGLIDALAIDGISESINVRMDEILCRNVAKEGRK